MSGKGIYRDESRIRHMCNALEKVVEKSRGVHRDDLVEGEDNTELIIHYLTILGDASNNVSAEFAGKHPEIDFTAMAGLRHKLVHDYANIDLGRIWTILQADFPGWEESVERLAATIEPVKTLPPNVADFD